MANVERAEENTSLTDPTKGKRQRPLEWMKFDPVKVSTEVEGLTLCEQGAYFVTFRHLWTNGPMTELQVRRLCRDHFGAIRDRMIGLGELLTFEWLEEARSHGEDIRHKRVKAGEARARQRARESAAQPNNGTASVSTGPAHASDSSASALSMSPSPSSSTSQVGSAERASANEPTYPADFPPCMCTPEALKAWDIWAQSRKEKGKPITATARKLQLADCASWGTTRAIAACLHSAKGNYQGLFEPSSHSSATDQRRATVSDRNTPITIGQRKTPTAP
jgi:hypothetical protein